MDGNKNLQEQIKKKKNPETKYMLENMNNLFFLAHQIKFKSVNDRQ